MLFFLFNVDIYLIFEFSFLKFLCQRGLFWKRVCFVRVWIDLSLWFYLLFLEFSVFQKLIRRWVVLAWVLNFKLFGREVQFFVVGCNWLDVFVLYFVYLYIFFVVVRSEWVIVLEIGVQISVRYREFYRCQQVFFCVRFILECKVFFWEFLSRVMFQFKRCFLLVGVGQYVKVDVREGRWRRCWERWERKRRWYFNQVINCWVFKGGLNDSLFLFIEEKQAFVVFYCF